MAYFDYSLPQLPDMGEGLRDVGDALASALRRRQQQKQFEANQTLQREVEDRKWEQQENQFKIQNRLADRLEKRDKARLVQENAEHRERIRQRVMTAKTPQEAAAIAREGVLYDPETDAVQHGTLVPGQAPPVRPEPTRPQGPRPEPFAPSPVPPEIAAMRAARVPKLSLTEPTLTPKEEPLSLRKVPTEAGNVPSPTRSMTSGLPLAAPPELRAQRDALRDVVREQRADALGQATAATAADEAGQKFDEANAAFPADHDRWLNEKFVADMRTPYTLKFGENDKGVEFDFQTQRYAGRSQDAKDFLAALPEEMRNTPGAQRAGALIMSGMPIKEAMAGFQKEAMQGTLLEHKAAEGEAARENKIDVANIMAHKPQPSLVIGGENLKFRGFEQLQKDLERDARRYGVTQDIQGMKQLRDGIRGIGSGNNALERGVGFQLARSMQGVGPLTQQDIDAVRAHIAGLGGTFESWVTKMTEGGLGDAEAQVMKEALEIRMAGKQAEAQAGRDAAERRYLGPNSSYRNWVSEGEIMSELDNMFPGTTSRLGVRGDRPAELPSRTGGKKSVKASGPPDAVGKLLEELDKRLGAKPKGGVIP